MLARWSRFARTPNSLSHHSFNRWPEEAAVAMAAASERRAIIARITLMLWIKAVSLSDELQINIFQSESAAAVGDFVPDEGNEW